MIKSVLHNKKSGDGLNTAIAANAADGIFSDSDLSIVLHTPRDRRIRKILYFFEQDPKLKLRDLARSVELSPSRLRHLFREQTGWRISRYMLALRLLRAATLLKKTEMRIKEVATHAGFPFSSNLDRAFKKAYGQNPTSFRTDKSTFPPLDVSQ